MPTCEQWAVRFEARRRRGKRKETCQSTVDRVGLAVGAIGGASRRENPRDEKAKKRRSRKSKQKAPAVAFFRRSLGKKRGESAVSIEDDLEAPRRDRGARFFRASFRRREDEDGESSSALDAGVARKRTNQAVLGGLPREVADVAAAALGGGGVAESGAAVAARLGGGGLGGRLVLADGDVAVAEGVAWRLRGLERNERFRSRSGGRTRRDRARGRVSSTRENPQPSPFAKNCGVIIARDGWCATARGARVRGRSSRDRPESRGKRVCHAPSSCWIATCASWTLEYSTMP